MAVSESQLKKLLSKYKYRDLTVHEITSVITTYKDLKPVMDGYVFNDGTSRELMSLTGTIPVTYKGLWCLGRTSSLFSSLLFQHPTHHTRQAGPPNTSYMPGMPAGITPYPPGHTSNPGGYQGYPYPSGGQYPPSTGPSHYSSQPPVTAAGPTRDGTISEDTIRASLISAVSDKLRWRMKEEMDRAQAELNALKRTEEDLKKGHQKLEEMVTRLDQEVADVDNNIELLKKKDEELAAALEKMENQSEQSDIDEVIIPTAPLYKQILNLYAEENAIEDTIFYLGEALRRGVLDLEVFLKHVRLLSRKQFQLRALMQKARKTAGLSDLY
ncbi:tumor susceptibility gene 101 protein [Microcaecilia unicolor]|uniref:Tumor susceptibility gene 101 protein n=1 Tax=Microcaecilia unicolor TaxID=1415580 RepID=A0A6P7Y6D3_9AMPH|nr:tumor susceptibility gene 101 protein [Microcaecilia unicolor]